MTSQFELDIAWTLQRKCYAGDYFPIHLNLLFLSTRWLRMDKVFARSVRRPQLTPRYGKSAALDEKAETSKFGHEDGPRALALTLPPGRTSLCTEADRRR